MKPLLLLLAAAVSISACQPTADETDASPVREQPAVAEAPLQPAVPRAGLIGPGGIGEARSGMTIGQLRAALPPGTTLGPAEPFMVEVTGLPVVRGADTLYHVLIVSGEPDGDDASITLVATRNAAFRTAEGVGPGTTVAAAAAAYGAATLSYSTSDESREYASFAGYRDPGIRFRLDGSGDEAGLAGVYASEGEYNETSEYAPAARIGLVMVDLRPAG